jgi:hypothetical protein
VTKPFGGSGAACGLGLSGALGDACGSGVAGGRGAADGIIADAQLIGFDGAASGGFGAAGGLGASGGVGASGGLGASGGSSRRISADGRASAGARGTTGARGPAGGSAATAEGLAAGGLGAGGASSSGSSRLTAVPHEVQNFAPGWSSEAHSEHAFIGGADRGGRVVRSCPHPPQRSVPGASPVPQDGQKSAAMATARA